MLKTTGRRTATGIILAAALAFPALTGAVDARTVTGNVGSLSPESIVQACPADITLQVEKQKHRPYQNTAGADIPAGVISGLTFEAQRVNGVDITTAEGWAEARDLSVDDAIALGLGTAHIAVTDVNGVARFPGTLPVGLYLVREIAPESPHADYKQSEPFLVTLPVGNATGDAWECDVVIKTKEEPTAPTTTPSVPTTTVTVPPETTTPTPTPSEPGTPVTTTPVTPPTTTPPRTPLASTGASVIGVVLAAAALLAGGGFLVFRRRSQQID